MSESPSNPNESAFAKAIRIYIEQKAKSDRDSMVAIINAIKNNDSASNWVILFYIAITITEKIIKSVLGLLKLRAVLEVPALVEYLSTIVI